MTPKQRLDRVERILGIMATAGRKAREEFREKINILIDSQIRSEDEFRERIKILTNSQNKTEELTRENSRAISENSKAIKVVQEQLQAVAVAQAELTQSQKLTDRALRDYLNSLPRRKNGNSSN
jgi:DNA polymerase III alpha subunit (gram-positive type)